MSGPKISFYTLTGRARAIVVGQLLCEQQSLACYAKTQELLRSVQGLFGAFDRQMQLLALLERRTGAGAEQREALLTMREQREKEREQIKGALAERIPRISEKYFISEQAYAAKKEELKRLRLLQKRAETLLSAVEAFEQEQNEGSASRVAQDNERIRQTIEESILADLNAVDSFESAVDRADDGFLKQKEKLGQTLNDLFKDRTLPEPILKEAGQAARFLQRIEEPQRLRTFEAITVRGIFRKIDEFRRKQVQDEQEYHALCARYEALCAAVGETAAAQASYSEKAAAAVGAQVERLEQELLRRREQAYISECVDEVMEEMGYELLGTREVRKKSGKHFRNELFTFREGTAVNVTFSDDGQIAMELGGLAREDRFPTPKETERLTREMESFCDEFAEFERRMLERGVVVGDRIALQPPTAEYAAILNVNDYDIAEAVQVSVMEAAEERRRQTDRRAMRREE